MFFFRVATQVKVIATDDLLPPHTATYLTLIEKEKWLSLVRRSNSEKNLLGSLIRAAVFTEQ